MGFEHCGEGFCGWVFGWLMWGSHGVLRLVIVRFIRLGNGKSRVFAG